MLCERGVPSTRSHGVACAYIERRQIFGAFQDIIAVIPVQKISSGYGFVSSVVGHRITDSKAPHSTHNVSRQSG